MLDAVRGALRGIVERERVTVLVHPEDLELVRDAMDDVRASLGGIEHCEVQAERRVVARRRHRPHARGRGRRPLETKLARAREVVEAELERVGMMQRARPRRRGAARRRPAPPPRPRLDLIGLIVEATGLEAEVGEVCTSRPAAAARPCPPRSSASAPAARC